MEAVTSFMTRNVCTAYVAAIPGAVLLAAWAAHNPQIFVNLDSDVVPVPEEEFAFKNGVILPHHEYLYGYSEVSGQFVVGKKSAGYDYYLPRHQSSRARDGSKTAQQTRHPSVSNFTASQPITEGLVTFCYI